MLLIQKLKELAVRRWCLEQTSANGWGCDALLGVLGGDMNDGKGWLAGV